MSYIQMSKRSNLLDICKNDSRKLIQIVMIQLISIMASLAIKRTWSLLAAKQLYIDQNYYYF